MITALPTLILTVACLTATLRGTAATNAVTAIENFAKVSATLYRGSQPDLQGLQQLKDFGIRSVINLRMTNDMWKPEPAAVAAHSMVYTNLPLNPLSAPTDEQVTSILAAISTLPKPVFVHCQYGRDRTGTIIACYRIREEKWSNAIALREAELRGLSSLETGMRRFIMLFKSDL